MNCIDYHAIAEATTYYSLLGYQRIEVPWWVTAGIASITKPIGALSDYKVSVNEKCLLASGEQAFLYLANKGQLPPGKYQTVTPCFRNEEYDAQHSKQFIKLELIQLLGHDEPAKQSQVQAIANEALGMFKWQLSKGYSSSDLAAFCDIVATNVKDPLAAAMTEQLDVVLTVPMPNGSGNNIELGSYGARHTSFATWIYGTGIAEPRFSKSVRRSRTNS